MLEGRTQREEGCLHCTVQEQGENHVSLAAFRELNFVGMCQRKDSLLFHKIMGFRNMRVDRKKLVLQLGTLGKGLRRRPGTEQINQKGRAEQWMECSSVTAVLPLHHPSSPPGVLIKQKWGNP